MVRARAPGTGPWLQERVGGGVGAGWQFQRRGRVAWLADQKSGGEAPRPPLGPGWGRVQGLGKGGSKGKMVFFEGCPVGWGKVQGLGEGSKGFGSGR